MFNDIFANEKSKCDLLISSYFSSNQSEKYCPPHFDGYYCWPATSSSTFAKIRCAFGHQKNEWVYRWCSANITVLSGMNVTLWQNAHYGKCLPLSIRQFGGFYGKATWELQTENFDCMMWWHKNFNFIDKIGLGISIIFLIIALSIFATFSQLQDTRVKIHINLFIAMLLYAVTYLTQTSIFGDKIDFALLDNLIKSVSTNSSVCRSLMTFSHYFELTIFTWILIEGWYFYSFISQAPYNEYVTIRPHVLAGWGLPLSVIIPWVIIHVYSTHTNFCWVDNDIKIDIMAIPVLCLITVNLCFFILNVRIIFIKMRSTYMSQKRMDYWRWIKSSLMLVPLYGTYDILYVIWPWVDNGTLKIGFLLIHRVICSFQGSFVSVLYCFTNNSVKREIHRAWYNWKLKREIDSQISKRYRSSENLTRAKVSDQISQGSSVDVQPDLINYF